MFEHVPQHYNHVIEDHPKNEIKLILRQVIQLLTIIGSSPQNGSKQNEPGGLYPFGKTPVNNQL